MPEAKAKRKSAVQAEGEEEEEASSDVETLQEDYSSQEENPHHVSGARQNKVSVFKTKELSPMQGQ